MEVPITNSFKPRRIPLALAALVPRAAMADLPGRHPCYLHMLSNLRCARWRIEHRPGDAQVSGDEDVAIARIDEAVNVIKRAAIDDGKDVNDDAAADHTGIGRAGGIAPRGCCARRMPTSTSRRTTR